MIRATDIGVVETELNFREEARPPLRESGSFSREEAKAEIGTPVRFRTDHRGFREGAVGHVVDYHENDSEGFEVVILLASPDGLGQVHERFGKAEYTRFLRRLSKT